MAVVDDESNEINGIIENGPESKDSATNKDSSLNGTTPQDSPQHPPAVGTL